MRRDRIVVIGGSAGALEALRTIVGQLPADLEAAIFIAVHTGSGSRGLLDRILQRAGPLATRYPSDGEAIRLRQIYLAPPDRHLLVKSDHVRVTRGPRENGFRPAIDPLFRTAASAHGSVVIGIVISGGGDDGVLGLRAIKNAGGIAMVQEPDDALVRTLPDAAIRHVRVDHVLPIGEIADAIVRLVREGVSDATNAAVDDSPDVAETGSHMIHQASTLGPPSPFRCPSCGGTLWQLPDDDVLHFQCHVGHRLTGDSLAEAQTSVVDEAMWTALRALEESAELRRRMAQRASNRGMDAIASSYQEQSAEMEESASLIRRTLMPESADRQHDREEIHAGSRRWMR